MVAKKPHVRLLSSAPMLVPSEEEYLTKYSSDKLLITSGSEQHTDPPQSLSEGSVNGVSLIPR